MQSPDKPAPGRFPLALRAFFEYLPALVLAMFILRCAELALGFGAGALTADVVFVALANDVLALLRYGPVLACASALALMLVSPRARVFALGAGWTLLLIVHAALMQYHELSGVPLGADVFGYNVGDIGKTVRASSSLSVLLGATLVVSTLSLWTALALHGRGYLPRVGPVLARVLAVCAAIAWIALPWQLDQGSGRQLTLTTLGFNKVAFFLDDSVRRAAAPADASLADLQGSADAPRDPRYPFLHAERVPDTLGPELNKAGSPPNIVFIIVEGLGRTFSGPGARLGSFTPFLDELAQRSLYFENHLATQGRTFGVLPSLLGSLPHGAGGFSAMVDRVPSHTSLPQLLKAQGYHATYFSGTDPKFDNQAAFLRKSGFGEIVSAADFRSPYKRSNDWGYADRDLVDNYLARTRAGSARPFVHVLQTVTMHTPFTFNGQAQYKARVDAHLDRLGIAADQRPAYHASRDIYSTILYTDDALRHYFAQAATMPGFERTIFVITGDHRLPELPMDTRIERYHVPLIVYSPLLKEPKRIKSVSSHFDVAPALLAMLSNQYGLQTPADVAWLGSGLDLEPGFRNLHTIPLKQTKTEMADFVSGTAYLSHDELFIISDGMQIDVLDDPVARTRAKAQFMAFRAANTAFAKAAVLAPAGAFAKHVPYAAQERKLRVAGLAAEVGTLAVSAVTPVLRAGGVLATRARFANAAPTESTTFVPLLVLTDAGGRELGEAYGKATVLDATGAIDVELSFNVGKLPPGEYFVSVLPSHPETGKAVGTGQFHVGVRL